MADTTTPTQVAHPWKAALRTGVQAFLGVAAVALIAFPFVSDFVESQWPGSPVLGWITVAASFVGGLSLLVSRIMAIPGVDAFLTDKVGLGAAPRSVNGGR